MIYRIEKCPVEGNSGGFYWVSTLKDAKRLQRRSFKEYLAVGGDGSAGVSEISLEVFKTPASKSDLVKFLDSRCSYPDNG